MGIFAASEIDPTEATLTSLDEILYCIVQRNLSEILEGYGQQCCKVQTTTKSELARMLRNDNQSIQRIAFPFLFKNTNATVKTSLQTNREGTIDTFTKILDDELFGLLN